MSAPAAPISGGGHPSFAQRPIAPPPSRALAAPTESSLHVTAFRDPYLDRESDDYGPGTGGKKRKVPAYPQLQGRYDTLPADSPHDCDDPLHDHHHDQSGYGPPTTTVDGIQLFPPPYRLARSAAAKAHSFKKALFLRRKAALIALFLDAQSALLAAAADPATTDAKKGQVLANLHKPSVRDIDAFERLVPSLEDVGLRDWPMDRPGWRNSYGEEVGNAAEMGAKGSALEVWRTGLGRKRLTREGRRKVVRGGWAPEGSFEFEKECQASARIRSRVKDQAALQKLASELRAIVLSTGKSGLSSAKAPLASLIVPIDEKARPAVPGSQGDEKQPLKIKRRLEQRIERLEAALKEKEAERDRLEAEVAKVEGKVAKAEGKAASKTKRDHTDHVKAEGQPERMLKVNVEDSAKSNGRLPEASVEMSKESSQASSKDASAAVGAGSGGKKKPKKKKRSVLANQSNPHHVDNYRSSRNASPPNAATNHAALPDLGQDISYQPHSSSLLFPLPLRLLSARPPRRNTANTTQHPQAESGKPLDPDDFLCCFCEMALFFGTEKQRRRAIRRMKEERRRKEGIREKARNVAEGKGGLKFGSEGEGGDSAGEEEGEGSLDGDDDEEGGGMMRCGEGRCTCGRPLSGRNRAAKSRLKPPETDPPPVPLLSHDDHHQLHHRHHQPEHQHHSHHDNESRLSIDSLD